MFLSRKMSIVYCNASNRYFSVYIFPMTLTPPSLIITILQHFGSGITSKYVPIKYSHALHISFSLFDCTCVQCMCTLHQQSVFTMRSECPGEKPAEAMKSAIEKCTIEVTLQRNELIERKNERLSTKPKRIIESVIYA